MPQFKTGYEALCSEICGKLDRNMLELLRNNCSRNDEFFDLIRGANEKNGVFFDFVTKVTRFVTLYIVGCDFVKRAKAFVTLEPQ